MVKDWKKVGKTEWFSDFFGVKLSVDYVKYVSDDLHWVVALSEADYMHSNIVKEYSFKSEEEAMKFAKNYMKKH